MPEANYPPEFESQVRKAMEVAEPDAEKLDALREQFIALGTASLRTDCQTDSPSKPFRTEKESNKMKRTAFFSTPRLAWGLLLLVLAGLITLALSSPEVANALQRLFGYVPGLGVVDQNTPFHVLAEPVSQTRDGVTITVEKAIMNEGSILLTYKTQGLTPDKFSFLEPLNTCMSVEELRFPNGEVAKPDAGISSMPLDGGYETTNRYSPVPVGIADAILFIPCINGSLSPGILPENWELPLRFVPAPPDVTLTMMPILDITQPTSTAMPSADTTPSPVPDAGMVNPLTVTKVVDAGDNGYILFGELNPPAPPKSGEWRIDWVSLDLVDNNGQTVFWQIPNDIDVPVFNAPHKLTWVIAIQERGFAPPLHITQRARYGISANSQETYSFEFDTGATPQPLQEWNLNQEFQFEGHTIRLTRISVNPVRTGYIFSFETNDSNVNSLSARIDGYPSVEHLIFPILFPGSNVGRWDYYEYYAETLPTGKLKVMLSNLYLNGETQDWTIDWQP